MTSVNITTTKNEVTVNEGETTVVTVATQGAQGESFAVTGTSLDDSNNCLLYTSPSPRDLSTSRMPSSA